MSRKSKKPPIEISDAAETARYGGSNADAETVSPVEPKTADGSDAIEAVRAELADVKDKLLRTRAEQQNLMKRQANELNEAVRYANASLIKDLLETIDNFERLEEQVATTDVDAIRKGARLIHDDLVRILEGKGLAVIEAKDKPFDPRCHEAMLQQPAPNTEPGTVIQVLQRGYVLGDRVLRPAKVVVSAVPEDGSVHEEECGAGASESAREE